MERKHSFVQQGICISCILLISLFLQSCNNLPDSSDRKSSGRKKDPYKYKYKKMVEEEDMSYEEEEKSIDMQEFERNDSCIANSETITNAQSIKNIPSSHSPLKEELERKNSFIIPKGQNNSIYNPETVKSTKDTLFSANAQKKENIPTPHSLGKEELERRNSPVIPKQNIPSITVGARAAEAISSKGGSIRAEGLTIEIPKDAVQNNTVFSIKPAPVDIQLPEGITPVTAVYAVEPHNIELRDYIHLTFNLPDSFSGNPYLFIQKEKAEDKELKKWLAIPPEKVENNKAIFKIKSCSFPFVGVSSSKKEHDLSPTPGTNGVTQQLFPDTICPGLNYRAKCENTNCEKSQELMVINRGFCENVNPNSEIDDKKIKCPKCGKILEQYESIKQLIFFNTSGKITYRIDKKPRPPAQTEPFSAMNGKMIIYGEVGATENYSSFTITATGQPFNDDYTLRRDIGAQFDPHGNPIGSTYDLGKDEMYKNVRVLIGKLYKDSLLEDGRYFKKDPFEKYIGSIFDPKEFIWKCIDNEADFLRELPQYDVAWIIGGARMESPDFLDKIIDFHKKRKGLMLWEDNDPSPIGHTNKVLDKLLGIKLEGKDGAKQYMTRDANCNSPSKFHKIHPVMNGIDKLYEGFTICHPVEGLQGSTMELPEGSPNAKEYKILATSSSGLPSIMCIDETPMTGRVIIDCGYTKLYSRFRDEAGIKRYVNNATCWLSGFPTDNT